MAEKKYDVVIIGAGLAGFAAAAEAADDNLKTLLVEKARPLVVQETMLRACLQLILSCRKRIMRKLIKKNC